MASQEIMHNLALAATNEMRQHFRNLWNEFTYSVAMDRPYVLLPRYLGDEIGTAALEAIATRFSIHCAQDVGIQFDPTKDAYVIGPPDNMPNGSLFRKLTVVFYNPNFMVYPHTPAWTPPPTPTPPDVVVASAVATSDTAPVRPNKIPKPANSFILYRRDKYAELCAKHPDSSKMPHKEFCVAGALWAAETAEVKEHYAELARELKQQSEVANPHEKKASRRSSKTNRLPQASPGQSLGESSGQSSGQISNNSVPFVPDS